MPQSNRTFRIFVSSTFSDLKAERNALQAHVFPRLRELCEQHGSRFQPIDLRWGVSNEASLDQQTMNICLGEIERCQKVTPRPNFIVLLGDRYGWCPPPPQIPKNEFEKILENVSIQDQDLLCWRADQPLDHKGWYRLDENAVPAEYYLQPRDGEMTDFEHWEVVERQLQYILETVARKIQLRPDELLKYSASATEQEIVAGALRVKDAREHVFCFFRKIEGLPQNIDAKDYIDLDVDSRQDENAARKLANLKSNLESLLQENVHHYSAEWLGDRITTVHIGALPSKLAGCMAMLEDGYSPKNLCEAVWRSLAQIIQKELSLLEVVDPLKAEIDAHNAFAHERARIFVGRLDPLAIIAAYLDSSDKHPLAIWGEPGSGKSALLAKVVQQAIENHPNAHVICRFIGATPDSTDGRTLLERLCREITRLYGGDEASVPLEFRELFQDFPKRLSMASLKQPLLILIDAPDQLSQADNARNLAWLPAELPEGVRMVVSTLPGECQRALHRKLPSQNLIELLPMSDDQGSELLDIWLAEGRRRLGPSQRRHVLEKFHACGLPLYLKLAFEEARLWKSSTPDKILSSDIHGAIRDLFGRLSSEANHGEVLVSSAFGYLAAARNGLSEDEMLDVLSLDKEVMADFLRRSPKSPNVDRLPVVIWSRFYFDLEPYLVKRNAYGATLLSFFHRQMAEIANDDYLSDDVILVKHRALAEHFSSQTLSIDFSETKRINQRMVSELPFQQTKAEMWTELESTLTDIKFIEAKCSVGLTYDLVQDYHNVGVSRLSKKFKDFADFVRNQAHILNIHPELTFQQIQLCHQDSAATIAAERMWQLGDYRRSWLRRVNKPSHRAPRLGAFSGHNTQIEACAFSPNGKRIASIADELIIWDAENATPLVTIPIEGGWNKACEFSPDNRTIVTPTGESISIWDIETGTLLMRLKGHTDNVVACAFSPDGKRIVSASWDKSLKLWDAIHGNELFTMLGHNKILFDCDYSPDGRHVVSASYDNTLKIWNPKNGLPITTLVGHTDAVSACNYSFDSEFILSASFDKTLKIWDAHRGIERKTLIGHQWPLNDCSYSPDGHYVVSVDSHGYIKFWDLISSTELTTYLGHAGDISSCAFSPDSEMLISGSSHETELKLWAVKGLLSNSASTSHQDQVISCAFSLDGQKVASTSHDKTTKIWDMDRGDQITVLSGHGSGVVACVFTPDNQRLVTASWDKTLKIWDINSGDLLNTLVGHKDAVEALYISPDGQRVLSGSRDNIIILWDLITGAKLYEQQADQESGQGLLKRKKLQICPECGYSSDGKYVLAPKGALLGILDVRDHKQIASLVTEGTITAIAWSTASNFLTAGDTLGNVYLLKLEGSDLGIISRDDNHSSGCPFCFLWSPIIKTLAGTRNDALEFFREQEKICVNNNYLDWLQWLLENQASILKVHGDLNGALALYQEQEGICRQVGNRHGLRASKRHQGLILRQLGDLDGAQVQFVEGERLCRELGDNYGLQAALCNQGVILSDHGDLKGAKKLFEEQERICRELGNIPGLIISLGNQGEVLQNLGDLENALRLYKEQEYICREHADLNGLRRSLSNQANLLEISGEFIEAEKLRIEYNKIGGASP